MHQHMTDAGYERKYLIVPRGHVLVWSANLVHGGPTAEVDGLTRSSKVTHYFFRNAVYNWVPVASDVTKNKIIYYDEAARDAKWGTRDEYEALNGPRFKQSKFRAGGCHHPRLGKSPCDCAHRIPTVLSTIFEHRAPTQGADVII